MKPQIVKNDYMKGHQKILSEEQSEKNTRFEPMMKTF